jgi:arsenical pump membrane protein
VLPDVVAVAALVALLVVAFAHPRGRVEALAGLAAAGVVLAVGAVAWPDAVDQTRRMLPVVLFLSAILVVAEACAAEGLFAAVGDVVRRAGRGDAHRILLVTFAAASVITAVLSLDATVVLLTPVVAAAVTGTSAERPVVHACVRLANSASLLLPVSNLTNLLALPDVSLSFAAWALVMAPVWVVVLVVAYAGVRLFFARDLQEAAPRSDTGPVPLPAFPLVVVGLMLVGFAVGSAYDVEPFWVAGAAALVLGTRAVTAGRVAPVRALHATHVPFGIFVLGLGVVVAALDDSFLRDVVRDVLPANDGLAALLVLALVATVLANLVNNLPATLLLVPLVAPLGDTAVLAALIGLNVGSGLAYPGSLANLLWRRTLVRRGVHVSGRTFHLHAALVTPLPLVPAVLTLCAVSPPPLA